MLKIFKFKIFKGKPVPDKGWAWVMFFCTCVNTFLVFGVHYTYGILYPSLLKEFNQGQGKTAWVGSLASGLLFLSSIAAIKCCEKVSVTFTCVIGSILSGGGLILTSFIQEFYWLYIVYGCLFGVGSSFIYTPSLIMVARWFNKYQSITTGIVTASGALGAVVLSPLIQYVITVNGLRNTIKAAGILYIAVSFLCSLSNRLVENADDGKDLDEEEGAETPCCTTSGSQGDKKQNKNDFRLNFDLFKNNTYLMFLIVMMITNFTYYIPIIHLVNYAEIHLKIPQSSASLLISIWSISNIVGRIFFGKLVSYFRRHLLRIYQVAMFFSGVVSLVTYFSNEYWMTVGYVITYGFLDGSFIGLLSLVTLEIVGMDDLAQGFGIMLTSIGVPIALGPYLIGVINDTKLLPPNIMFTFAGVPFLVGSFLMIIIIRWNKEDKERLKNSDPNTKTALLESSSTTSDNLENSTIDDTIHLEYITSL